MIGSASSSDYSTTSSINAEYDISKLLDTNVNLHSLNREHKYNILAKEPNHDLSIYPRGQLCGSASIRRFQPQPSQNNFPGFTIVDMWMVYSAVDGVFSCG